MANLEATPLVRKTNDLYTIETRFQSSINFFHYWHNQNDLPYFSPPSVRNKKGFIPSEKGREAKDEGEVRREGRRGPGPSGPGLHRTHDGYIRFWLNSDPGNFGHFCFLHLARLVVSRGGHWCW